VRAVLEDPARLEQEYRRRDEALRERPTPADRRASAAHRRKLEQGLARLIDSYAEDLLLKEEFAPRLGRLRQRCAALEEQARQDADQDVATQDLRLLVGRLDEFASKVRAGLADVDWHLRRASIRALVKQIEVSSQQVMVVFRVGPQLVGPGRQAIVCDIVCSGMLHALHKSVRPCILEMDVIGYAWRDRSI